MPRSTIRQPAASISDLIRSAAAHSCAGARLRPIVGEGQDVVGDPDAGHGRRIGPARTGRAQPGRYGASSSMLPTNSGRPAMAEDLADREDLAGVEPVVVDHPLEGRADRPARAATRQRREQVVGRQAVEPRIGRGRHLGPGAEHRRERRRRGRPAVGRDLVELRPRGGALGPADPVALLVPGHVGDDPADRVHRLEPFRAVRLRRAAQAAPELRSGEVELPDERQDRGVGHPSECGVGPGAPQPRSAAYDRRQQQAGTPHRESSPWPTTSTPLPRSTSTTS